MSENHTNQQSYKTGLLIFSFLHIGLILELILIGHHESFWQALPLISLTLGLATLAFKGGSLQLVKIIYLLIMVVGVVGVFLHLKNNWEFELEMYPGMDWADLLVHSFTGALPALAPGTLIPIGWMGFHLIQLKNLK